MTKFSRGLNLVSGLDAPLVGKTFFFEHDFFASKNMFLHIFYCYCVMGLFCSKVILFVF